MDELNQTLSTIEDIIKEISASLELPDDFLVFSKNKDSSYSLFMREPVTKKTSKMIFKIIPAGKKRKYMSVAVKKAKIKEIDIPETIETKELLSDELNTYVIFLEMTSEIKEFINSIIIDYVENFKPSEKFGCCHRYKECSDAQKCLHPDQFYSRACWYRENLENGKIFY